MLRRVKLLTIGRRRGCRLGRMILWWLQIWRLMILRRRYFAQLCGIDVVLRIHVISIIERIVLPKVIWHVFPLIHEALIGIGLIQIASELIVLEEGLLVLVISIEVGLGGTGLDAALLLLTAEWLVEHLWRCIEFASSQCLVY